MRRSFSHKEETEGEGETSIILISTSRSLFETSTHTGEHSQPSQLQYESKSVIKTCSN